MERNAQIGVMGSCSDLEYSTEVAEIAEKIGHLIAQRKGVLLFGAEKDMDSLSTAASRGAKKNGGITIGITYGKDKEVLEESVDIVIPTGMERGGGREFVLALACDAIITIGGGSGTLSEIAAAYQANIPIIVLVGYGGWSDELADKFLDPRNRVKCIPAKTPEEAVELAFAEAHQKHQRRNP